MNIGINIEVQEKNVVTNTLKKLLYENNKAFNNFYITHNFGLLIIFKINNCF